MPYGVRHWVLVLCVCGWGMATAQPVNNSRRGGALRDTVGVDTVVGTVTADSVGMQEVEQVVRFSRDSLDAPVNYSAEDSMIYDIAQSTIRLYGKAQVTYKDLEITAGYIAFDWANSVVRAQFWGTDSLGQVAQKPHFVQGEQSFDADSMRYNIKTQKGKVYAVTTSQSDGFLHSGESKFNLKADTSGNSVVYSLNNFFTTCTDQAHPHFGIRSQKAKIIPNKLIVVGPSNLEIGGIPTPLFLPFGFFPITQTRRSGLIFPNDYDVNERLGIGIRGIGYYWGISDHHDLRVVGDIYSRGSFKISLQSNYAYKYRSNGNITLELGNTKYGQKGTSEYNSQRSYLLRWSHTQDSKANPYHSFSGNASIQINNHLSALNTDANSVLNNILNSSVTYRRNFIGKPYSFTAGFTHTQNTSTRAMTVVLPTLNFNVFSVAPFKRKKAVGKERWYEKVTFNYATDFKNEVSLPDTMLFTRTAIDTARFGMQHTLTPQMQFKLFKYINVSPTFSFTERWYAKAVTKTFVNEPDIRRDTTFQNGEIVAIDIDTLSYGFIRNSYDYRFVPVHTYNTGIGINTNLFGTINFKKGKIRALRHVLSPSINFRYSPDYSQSRYFDTLTVLNTKGIAQTQRYAIYENAVFGMPSTTGKTSSIAFSLGQTLEAKIYSRKDTLNPIKKIQILRNLNASMSYDLARDSLNWSPLSTSGSTTLFKKIGLVFNAAFDPYALSAEGKQINTSHFQQTGKILRFTNAGFSLNTSLTTSEIQSWLNAGSTNPNLNPFPLSRYLDRFSLTYSFAVAQRKINGTDTLVTTSNTIGISQTSIRLTPKWRIDIGNIGYNFASKNITYPDVGFYRDLHCWEMGMNWQPVAKTFNFRLNVKPGTLGFLKIPYNKTRFDDPFN
jgi:hypothetical protein